jgi:hypothetical protein
MLSCCFGGSTRDLEVEGTALTISAVCAVLALYHLHQGLANANIRKVYHDTTISHGSGPRTVRMNDVLVVSKQNADPSELSTVQQIKCDAMDIEFEDSNGKPTRLCCQSAPSMSLILSSLCSMQSHLFHLYLTRPFFGEQTLFRRFAGNMIVQDHLLPSATISLVYSPRTDAYRFILLASTQAVSVGMPLSPRQLEDLMTNQNAGSKQFSAYFLIRDTEGTEVIGSSAKLDELVPSGIGVGLHPLLSTGDLIGQGGEGRMIEDR